MSYEQRIQELGIAVPTQAVAPIASYVSATQSGNLLYVSGQGPIEVDGTKHTGKVGAEVSTQQAKEHARLVGINILAAVREYCGSLDQVAGVVKLLGMVNATPEFTDHPEVINGCSDLLLAVFGDAGRHARSAVGFASLPLQITVEIEAIFELK